MELGEELRGVGYSSFLSKVSQAIHPRCYLEIGVRDGLNLAGISCDTAIGIDPAFCIRHNIAAGKRKGVELHTITSDAFFSRSQEKSYCFDMAFLDGLHQWEYLLRDFANTEVRSSPTGLIFLHDCVPLNWEMTERQHDPSSRKDRETASWWTGDVWKLLAVLACFRKDLRLTILDCPPTGIVAISNLNPFSFTLKEKYHEIVGYVSEHLNDGEASLRRILREHTFISSQKITERSEDLSLFFPLS